MTTLQLGCCDAGAAPANGQGYFSAIHEPSMASRALFRGEEDGEWCRFEARGTAVTEIQRFLEECGFMPHGKIDGICGYRTASSMRLFQEYVRTVEGDASIGPPDGVFGPQSLAHVARWRRDALRADWAASNVDHPDPEYRRWLRLLETAKRHYAANPTTLLEKLRSFPDRSDTLAVADWTFDPREIHLIGIRRDEAKPGARSNDDVFVLLIAGIVFAFYGTTDPGKSEHGDGAPFLVPGQHLYRFGWHKMTDMNRVYRALKPAGRGVLVIRDANRDDALSESDLAGDLEANPSINVHWGGKGTSNWSAGCQVVCGKGYINHHAQKVDCASFAASTYTQLGSHEGSYYSKGAYSVLVDLVTAFSGSVHAARYMLLYEQDLELEPELGAGRARAILEQIA